MNWKGCPGIQQNPNICGGEYTFLETRVPVRALFENLRDGAKLYDFLEWFPGVSEKDARHVLKWMEKSLQEF
ncbi:MAG: DUF433 domain-containing protein [Verrucomicrobia bacterium]|jgi:uncharacterized protein (DUF433 family)|nr:DUF433 domain-containing protein [Verrucomicrobiota bacterium]